VSPRGGRQASLPAAQWEPPRRLLPGGTSVRFIEESGGREKTFDFTAVDAPPEIRRWLARVLARRAGARAETRRITTAGSHFLILRVFASVLAASDPPARTPADVSAGHIALFTERHAGLKSQGDYLAVLRTLLRDDPEISEEARTAIAEARVPRPAGDAEVKAPGYSPGDWQLITTAMRADIRAARDRIREGRALLERFRSGAPLTGGDRAAASLLDAFDRGGDFPRYAGGSPVNEVTAAGGVAALASRLCLTLREATAFALLLTAVTGENFGTVAAWPAASFRPDGDRPGTPAVALVEAVKPRRGPDREHMITSLEDLPPGLAKLMTGDDGEPRLFRSPLRLYELLVDLSSPARRHGGFPGAFCSYNPWPGRYGGSRWADGVQAHHVVRWAREHGFPSAGAAVAGSPAIDVRRIRQTVIEHKRRPVAHTRATMNDQYLSLSPDVRADSREVVAAALRDEVAKARERCQVPVWPAEFTARAQADPAAAAAEAGLEPEALQRLLSGEQDTPLASCTDHLAGPASPPGTPCQLSFLACLDCANARALPHQLPVQLAAADKIAALRPHLDPAVWQARWEPRLQQLAGITAAYTTAERQQARQVVTAGQQQMIDDLMEGRWDLR
jgi:hypothetical protein